MYSHLALPMPATFQVISRRKCIFLSFRVIPIFILSSLHVGELLVVFWECIRICSDDDSHGPEGTSDDNKYKMNDLCRH